MLPLDIVLGVSLLAPTIGAAGATFVVTIVSTALSVLAAPEGRELPGRRATGHVPVALVGTLVLYGALIEELLIRWVPGSGTSTPRAGKPCPGSWWASVSSSTR